MLRKWVYSSFGFAAIAVIGVAGCDYLGSQKPAATQSDKPSGATPLGKDGENEHVHKPGNNGGTIVEIGRDNYHAEAVFDKNGVVRVYTLGKDESTVVEVENQTLTAYARVEGGTEQSEFSLAPATRKDDSTGKTSQFVGTLPKELWGKRVEVTVPSIRINGDRFRFGFSSSAGEAHTPDMPPSQMADAEERNLYLTPGGKYTAADIKANGNVTASLKFKGISPSHDLKPKTGDKICPITLTKANPKLTWVVDGKPYEFCCPPCVEEFVKQAKEKPEEIKDPGEFIKK